MGSCVFSPRVHPSTCLDVLPCTTDGALPFLHSPCNLTGHFHLRAHTADTPWSTQGYLTVKLEAHAPAGHSSSPPKVSAIATLARAIVALEEHPVPAHLSPADDLFGSLAPGGRCGTALPHTHPPL